MVLLQFKVYKLTLFSLPKKIPVIQLVYDNKGVLLWNIMMMNLKEKVAESYL